MPKFLEQKLFAEYGPNSKIPYKVMNAQGLMKGPRETAKGRAMQATHEADMKKHAAASGHPHRNLGKYLHAPRKK